MRVKNLTISAMAVFVSGLAIQPAAHGQVAPDVVVLCDASVAHAMTDVGRLWTRDTGVPVHVIPAETPQLLAQITHHIRSDFIVAEGDDTAATAVAQNLIKAETRQGGWRDRLVVAARAGEPARSAPASPALVPLVASGSIAVVDAPVAVVGAESRKSLEAAGLWDAAAAHSIGVANTQDAAYLVTHDRVKLAVVYATDLAADPGLVSVASLPDESYAPLTFWVAETNAAVSPKADAFGAFLRTPAAQQRLRADGLETTS